MRIGIKEFNYEGLKGNLTRNILINGYMGLIGINKRATSFEYRSMSKITYFAKDGSFGSAKGLECIDTTHWTEKDWERVEYASDNKRIQVAKRIARKYRPKTHEIKNWTKLDWEEYEWELAQMKKEQGKKKKKKKK